ncbi:Hpt domain-containing protein [Duganella violaceipulchra]|uniref:Hpt domain-containing protein n=1 Tax=Duganella violaceipulchra TaxID=2849652 RepID=A0AA41HKH9_9BURK|nr:Hpt domain-containing protein [Duganella violaceicalia]MBV6325493.1 Hpt domain-containing protein [Duganella violaceicalia]MCP2012665.1 two-component system sensor histidine kinase/response regulator [Duganella violaceicalia]
MNAPADAVLDVASGLQQLMGDYALYLNILRRFQQRYHAAAAEVGAALAAGERAGATRIVHTVKGAAGMIGARQVQQLAAVLEAAGCAAPLAPLEQALARLMEAIAALLAAAPAAASPAPPAAAPDARLLLQRLARLLEEGDGAAIDVLEQSATLLAGALGVARFAQVTSAAHQFDFETALAQLRAAPA